MTTTFLFRSIILISTFTIQTSTFADQSISFDMGESGTQSQPVNEGPVTLQVINRLSAEKYFLEEIRIENTSIEGLTPIGKISNPLAPDGTEIPEAEAKNLCQPLNDIVAKIQSAKTEQDLSKYRNEWNAKKIALIKANIRCPAEISQGEDLLNKSIKKYPPYILKKGQRLVLTIKRKSGDDKEVTWTFIAATQPRGQWVGSWGVAFVPNKDRDYYARSDGAGAFTVTEKQDNDSVNLIPAVFYTWLPKTEETDDWVFSPVGGLGLDKSNLTLLFGINGTYNRNLSLSLGAITHQQRRLKGEFTPGQTINEALTSDALTELAYKVNWFVSMGLRF